MARNTEMAVGLHKGHKTTKTVQKPKPSRRKGVRVFHYLFNQELLSAQTVSAQNLEPGESSVIFLVGEKEVSTEDKIVQL